MRQVFVAYICTHPDLSLFTRLDFRTFFVNRNAHEEKNTI